MTPDQIKELRRLWSEATAGEWVNNGVVMRAIWITNADGLEQVAMFYGPTTTPQGPANADLCVALHNAAPALLTAGADLAALRIEHRAHAELLTAARREREEARATVDAMRREIIDTKKALATMEVERDELRASLATVKADHALLVQALLTTVKTLRDPRLCVSEGTVDGIVAGIKSLTGIDVDAALAGSGS